MLCRLALGGGAIDAASFAALRLVSGAVALVLIASLTGRGPRAQRHGDLASAAMLFGYAVAFSFAYRNLSAGTGALILFGAVQATMLLFALRSGERPRAIEWVGLSIAMIGLVVLVFPGLRAPSPLSSALMAAAGICWGIYSLRGRRAGDPIAATTANFVLAAPAAVAVSLVALPHLHASAAGASLAVISGAVTSGAGYVVWYAALRGLTATRAALVQLSVPALAAAGGVLFLAERPSLRFLAAAVLILGGIGAAVTSRREVRRAQ